MQKREVEIVPNKVEQEQHNSAHFGKIEFWENYYLTNVNPFDWYQDYDGIKDIITQYLTKSNNILNLGCGTSPIPEELYKEGYKKIVNVDYSENCIKIMNDRYSVGYDDTFSFAVCDVRDMRAFKDGAFDVVVDKGCLDCVLGGEYSMQNARKMLSQVSRVLSDNGIYILITYGDDGSVFDPQKEQEGPGPRKPILCKSEYEWKLKNTYKVYKPNIQEDDPSFDINSWENYHYIYVLKKGEHVLSPGSLQKRSMGFQH